MTPCEVFARLERTAKSVQAYREEAAAKVRTGAYNREASLDALRDSEAYLASAVIDSLDVLREALCPMIELKPEE